MLFLLKKIVAPLFYPLVFCLLLLITGLALLRLGKRQKAGKLLICSGTLLLILFGYGFGTHRLLRSLEHRFPPARTEELRSAELRWVIVLGGGASSDPDLPPSSRLSESSLAYLVEGVRLHRQLPGSRLIFSGGRVFGTGSDADLMGDLAVQLGVARESITTEAASRDTETQAQNVRALVGGDAFLLVTSASHMPRAVALFRGAGMNPVPAPTHYLSPENEGVSPSDFFPSLRGLRKSETVIYEYLSLLWAKIRGRA